MPPVPPQPAPQARRFAEFHRAQPRSDAPARCGVNPALPSPASFNAVERRFFPEKTASPPAPLTSPVRARGGHAAPGPGAARMALRAPAPALPRPPAPGPPSARPRRTPRAPSAASRQRGGDPTRAGPALPSVKVAARRQPKAGMAGRSCDAAPRPARRMAAP